MRFDPADGGYGAWIARALRPFPPDRALRSAVGGDFEAMGAMQLAILKHAGLRPGAFVVDVGCGVGRLASALTAFPLGAYVGTDPTALFLRAARRTVRAPGFRFVRVRGTEIPVADASADIVCFFSVFTHLLQEQTFLYLEQARRVLKPGGRIVFSFHELASSAQWPAFAATVEHLRAGKPRTLNVFVERPAIAVWAEHLDLEIVEMRAGDEPFAALETPITFASGAVQRDFGCLGQSVAILARR
jgi:SAM-dependent methyltransferase